MGDVPEEVAGSKRKRSSHALSERESEDDDDDDTWKVLREEGFQKAPAKKRNTRKRAPAKKKGGVNLPKSLVTSISKNLNKLREVIEQQDGQI